MKVRAEINEMGKNNRNTLTKSRMVFWEDLKMTD